MMEKWRPPRDAREERPRGRVLWRMRQKTEGMVVRGRGSCWSCCFVSCWSSSAMVEASLKGMVGAGEDMSSEGE